MLVQINAVFGSDMVRLQVQCGLLRADSNGIMQHHITLFFLGWLKASLSGAVHVNLAFGAVTGNSRDVRIDCNCSLFF